MSEDTFVALTNALNLLSFVLYLILLGIILGTLIKRVSLYRLAKEKIPLLLKRDLALYLALALVFGEILFVRITGTTVFTDPGWPRIAFVAQQNLVILGALAYWAKVELTDL